MDGASNYGPSASAGSTAYSHSPNPFFPGDPSLMLGLPRCVALYDYFPAPAKRPPQPQDEEETEADSPKLSFQKNELILIIAKDVSGWWNGMLLREVEALSGGRPPLSGWFPQNYVKEIFTAPAEAERSQLPADEPATAVAGSVERGLADLRRSVSELQSLDLSRGSPEQSLRTSSIRSPFPASAGYSPVLSALSSAVADTLDHNYPPNMPFSPALIKSPAECWNALVEAVVGSVSQLNADAKLLLKSKFIEHSILTTINIRYLLRSAGCLEKTSPLLAQSRTLRHKHADLFRALSILAKKAKLAAAADSTSRDLLELRRSAAQLLLATREFVQVALARNVPIQALEPAFELAQVAQLVGVEPSTILFRDGRFQSAMVDGLGDGAAPGRAPAKSGDALELLNDFSLQIQAATLRFSESVSQSLRGIQDAQAIPMRLHPRIASEGQSLTNCVGRFTAFAEENVEPLNLNKQDASAQSYAEAKRKLLIAANDTVVATSTATQPYTMAFSYQQIFVVTAILVEAVREMLIACKGVLFAAAEARLEDAGAEGPGAQYLLRKRASSAHDIFRIASSEHSNGGVTADERARRAGIGGGSGAAALKRPSIKIDTQNLTAPQRQVPLTARADLGGHRSHRRKSSLLSFGSRGPDSAVSESSQRDGAGGADFSPEFHSARFKRLLGMGADRHSMPLTTTSDSSDEACGTPNRTAPMPKSPLALEHGVIHSKSLDNLRGGGGGGGGAKEGGVPDTVPGAVLAQPLSPQDRKIIFDSDGENHRIKAGTLPALIEQLTFHLPSMAEKNDNEFKSVFLETFRLFSSPQELWSLLQSRFRQQPPKSFLGSEKLVKEWKEHFLVVVQARVYLILKRWFAEFFNHAIDLPLVEALREFTETEIRPVFEKDALDLLEILDLREKGHNLEPSLLVPPRPVLAPPPPALLQKMALSDFSILEYDPAVVARQLTIMDSNAFLSISRHEWLTYKPNTQARRKSVIGSLDDSKAQMSASLEGSNRQRLEEGLGVAGPHDPPRTDHSNIRRMIHHSNMLTGFVAQAILSERDLRKRCAVLKHFIKIAQQCHLLNNFASRESILAAINSSPIYRLKRTFENLSAKTRLTLETLMKYMDRDNNRKAYRDSLKAIRGPCVPFLGLFLTDITFTMDGNPTLIQSERLINMDKFSKLASILHEIFQYQAHQYPPAPTPPELYAAIVAGLSNAKDADALFELSIEVEPREREDEKILRLLQETGFS